MIIYVDLFKHINKKAQQIYQYLVTRNVHKDDSQLQPKSIKANELHTCNLTSKDYFYHNHWIGKGNKNCTDSKVLRRIITAEMGDLGIKQFEMTTFDENLHVKYPNDTSLEWSTLYYLDRVCFTMTIPKKVVNIGIYKIQINVKENISLKIVVHQKGLLYTDMPDSIARLGPTTKFGYKIPVGHEILQMKRYNGERCQSEANYQLDKCRHEYIEKVNNFFFNNGYFRPQVDVEQNQVTKSFFKKYV